MAFALIKNEEIFCFVDEIPKKEDMAYEEAIDIKEPYDYRNNYTIHKDKNKLSIKSELKPEFIVTEPVVDQVIDEEISTDIESI